MRYVEHNANPEKRRVGDCTVRAISAALGDSWEKTYIDLCVSGYMLHDMPSANEVWGEYLKYKGFKRYPIQCEDCGYTVSDFCRDNPQGVFILSLPSHVICVKDGEYYDSWDSGEECPVYFWAKD